MSNRSFTTMENKLFFNDNIELENENALLRILILQDIEHLVYFSENEPDLWKYSMIQANGKNNLTKYIELALQDKDNLKELPFIVFDKKQQKYADSTRFYDIRLANNSLQLGFTWYGKDFQGTGLNKIVSTCY